GRPVLETIEFLTDRGIPVCGHLGLMPQSVYQIGGYKVEGKGETAAPQLQREAKQRQEAGARITVLDTIPAPLAGEVTKAIRIPTIGIGAGADCSGQVLVLYDMLDIFPGRKAKFVKNFLRNASSIHGAVELYVKEVKAGAFPAPEHSFSA